MKSLLLFLAAKIPIIAPILLGLIALGFLMRPKEPPDPPDTAK